MLALFKIFSPAITVLLFFITPSSRCLNNPILLERQSSGCGTDPDWQPTVAAWESGSVDSWLQNWWTSTEGGSTNTSASFTHDLASDFGPQSTDFTCGIGEISRCSAPGCTDYSNQNQPTAPYLALLAVTQLNTLYNAIFTGISNGQEDVLGLTTNITSTFLTPESPSNNVAEGILLSIFLGPLVSIIGGLIPIGRAGGALVNGAAGILSSGVQSIFTDSTLPNTPLNDASSANLYISRYSEKARNDLQNWAADTFAGKQDLNNKMIIDYMSGGSLISVKLPQASDVEQFYKKQMVSRIVQNLWQTQYIPFIVTYTLNNCKDDLDDDVPHYFDASGCVQSVIKVKGSMSDSSIPYGWKELQGAAYNISIRDIVLSSVRAWAVARNNYTESIATRRLEGLTEQASTPISSTDPSSSPSSPSSSFSTSPSSSSFSSHSTRYSHLSSSSTTPTPSVSTGSVDQCGAYYDGAICDTGLCCSRHGYCGSTSDYCTDCQPDYGYCPSYNWRLMRDNQDLGSQGVLYGPFSATGNWSYSLVADESTPFTEGAAFEGTWQFPVCERTTDVCVDLTNPIFENGTDLVHLCCGQRCVDTDLFKNATGWTTDPSYLYANDPNVGELPMYGYCSNDQDNSGDVAERVDLKLVLFLWLGWWVVCS